MEHHAKVQKLRLFSRELPVRAQGVEYGLCRALAGLIGVEEHTLLVKMPALHLIGVGHYRGHPGNKGYALAHIVLKGHILRVVVIGV